jgi:hypothetical protein
MGPVGRRNGEVPFRLRQAHDLSFTATDTWEIDPTVAVLLQDASVSRSGYVAHHPYALPRSRRLRRLPQSCRDPSQPG